MQKKGRSYINWAHFYFHVVLVFRQLRRGCLGFTGPVLHDNSIRPHRSWLHLRPCNSRVYDLPQQLQGAAAWPLLLWAGLCNCNSMSVEVSDSCHRHILSLLRRRIRRNFRHEIYARDGITTVVIIQDLGGEHGLLPVFGAVYTRLHAPHQSDRDSGFHCK